MDENKGVTCERDEGRGEVTREEMRRRDRGGVGVHARETRGGVTREEMRWMDWVSGNTCDFQIP